jgi:hypothetical protein
MPAGRRDDSVGARVPTMLEASLRGVLSDIQLSAYPCPHEFKANKAVRVLKICDNELFTKATDVHAGQHACGVNPCLQFVHEYACN